MDTTSNSRCPGGAGRWDWARASSTASAIPTANAKDTSLVKGLIHLSPTKAGWRLDCGGDASKVPKCSVGRGSPVPVAQRGRKRNSAQEIFQLHPGVGLAVTILHDHRRIERDAPLLADSVCDRAGAGYHDGFLGDHQRLIVGGSVNLAAHDIVDGSGTGENGPAAQHGSALDHRALLVKLRNCRRPRLRLR